MEELRDSSAQHPAAQPPHWLMASATGRIQDGLLPRSHQSKVIAGPGRGQRCALCDHDIVMGDVCYLIATGEGSGSTPSLNFHVPCYRAWMAACSALPRAYVSRNSGEAGAGEG